MDNSVFDSSERQAEKSREPPIAKRSVYPTVDKSNEEWLDTIEERISYDKWYRSHYYMKKTVDKVHFLFESIIRL